MEIPIGLNEIVKKYLGEKFYDDSLKFLNENLLDPKKVLNIILGMTQFITIVKDRLVAEEGEEFYVKFQNILIGYCYEIIEKISGKKIKTSDFLTNSEVMDELVDELKNNNRENCVLVISTEHQKSFKIEIPKKDLEMIIMINSYYFCDEEGEYQKIVQTFLFKKFITKKENREISFIELVDEYFQKQDEKKELFDEFYRELKQLTLSELLQKYVTEFQYTLKIDINNTNKTVMINIPYAEKLKIDELNKKLIETHGFSPFGKNYLQNCYLFKRFFQFHENKKIDYNDLLIKSGTNKLAHLLVKFGDDISNSDKNIDFFEKYLDKSEYEIFTKQQVTNGKKTL